MPYPFVKLNLDFDRPRKIKETKRGFNIPFGMDELQPGKSHVWVTKGIQGRLNKVGGALDPSKPKKIIRITFPKKLLLYNEKQGSGLMDILKDVWKVVSGDEAKPVIKAGLDALEEHVPKEYKKIFREIRKAVGRGAVSEDEACEYIGGMIGLPGGGDLIHHHQQHTGEGLIFLPGGKHK